MMFLRNSYPIALLAFSLFLIWWGYLWFSILVFLVSAFCWFGSWVNLKQLKDDEE